VGISGARKVPSLSISLAETKKKQKSEFPIPQDSLFITDPEKCQLVPQGANFLGEIFRVCNWAMVKVPVSNVRRGVFIQQVHKFLLRIVFSPAFKGPYGFFRQSEDLTPGALCPPTLTLPLGGGREGWG
jgi:hypothetical protein